MLNVCDDDDDDDDDDDGRTAVCTAYEYVADSEECHSESTMSSTLEATQHTVSEPDIEEVSAYDEDVVVMADVHWWHQSLVEPQQSELASEFTLERTDGQRLIEHEFSVEQLVTPKISGRAQTLVQLQTPRFEDLDN